MATVERISLLTYVCVVFRYRRWLLNPEDKIDILVRCEIDGVLDTARTGTNQLLSIKVCGAHNM